jgi:hypothetical protein
MFFLLSLYVLSSVCLYIKGNGYIAYIQENYVAISWKVNYLQEYRWFIFADSKCGENHGSLY